VSDGARLAADPAESERERRRGERDTSRVAAFSDGVFAIAATLLVLDLNISEIGAALSDADLLAALGALGPTFVGVVISYLILCFMWWTHVQMFRDIESADASFVSLNSVRLLFVVLIPFTTSLMSAYAELALGDVLLALNVLAIVGVGWLQQWYVTGPGGRLAPGLGLDQRRDLRREGLAALLVAAVVVVLAWFIGPLAFVLFVLDPLVTRVLVGHPIEPRSDAA
jgi:uncharacterized membrane protein